MSVITLSEEELAQKHKRERKELQAQVQTLKKSICKGDKKKKKEIGEEIVKKEEALDKQHQQELIEWKLAHTSINNDDSQTKEDEQNNDDVQDEEEEKPAQRITKAQKRREKKQYAERERNQRIIEQEALNVFGKRNMEIQAINKILYARDLMIHEIPSDGHCLYNAVAHQLAQLGEPRVGFNDLRMKTAEYLRENMDNYLPFISNSDSDGLLSPEQYEKYCSDIANTSAWGGAIELQVLSHVLKCPIEVIQAVGAPYIIGDEYTSGKKVTVTYHRYIYELGAHYNSVTKYGNSVCTFIRLCTANLNEMIQAARISVFRKHISHNRVILPHCFGTLKKN